ncbi:hypothetical protein BGX29_010502 [Mortierella sp. GBA35]|nr:hypothetical protein BGX29_010502 [Mortierella sp. GBA35]
MTQLTRLGINFGRANSFDDCPYQLPSYNDPRAAVAQACWIIRSNPHLEEFIMLNLVFRDKHDVRLLANSLFRLCNLRYLHLGLICDTEKVATFGTDISFGCPPSIEQLRIDTKHVPDARYCDVIMMYMNPWHHYDSHSDESDDDIAGNSDDNNLNGGSGGNGDKHNKIYRYYEKTTPRRKDPLLNLVDLWLWDMCSDAIDENLQSIYHHCPRVERISGPYLYKELMGTQDMVQLIGQGYTSIIFESESWQVNHHLPFKISVALPEQQLEEFRCDLKYGGLDETMASKDGNHGRLLIGPPDAATSPWACTKIRHLELSIGMLKMFSFDSTISAPQFRECDPPNFITTNKEQQFELLEMFYRQIGSLTELTCLDLRVEWKLSDDSVVWPCAIAFKKTWFPVLMALGHAKTDRPGYLHLLEGLGKLRELRGSVYVDTDEAKATMGEQEAAWDMPIQRNTTMNYLVLEPYEMTVRRATPLRTVKLGNRKLGPGSIHPHDLLPSDRHRGLVRVDTKRSSQLL